MTVKRFHSPRCTVCNNSSDSAAIFESADFAGFIICAYCQAKVTQWLWDAGLLDINPFAEVILDEGTLPDSPVYYRYMQRPGMRIGIYGQLTIRRVPKDISQSP